MFINKDYIASFLAGSIEEQKNYLDEHSEERETIVRYVQSYLQSPSTQPNEELKLKAWLLLPKHLTNGLNFREMSVNPSFEREVVKSVIKTKEYWRLEQLKKWGIHIDDPSVSWIETDDKGKTPLHYLCENGNEELALELLKTYCKSQGISDVRGVIIALNQGLIAIAKSLVDEIKVAKPSLINIQFLNDAILARAPLDIIEPLLEYRSDTIPLDACGKDEVSLFRTALTISPPDLELIQFFIDQGVNVNQPDSEGDTALHWVLFLERPPVSHELVAFLLANKADVNAINNKGESCSYLMKIRQIETPPSAHIEHDTEFELRRHLAASWSLTKRTQMSGKTFLLEGGRHGDKGKVISRLRINKATNFIDFDNACELVEKSFKTKESPEVLEKKFKAGEKLVFLTGWKEHAVNVIFIGKYMMVMNRLGKQRTMRVYIIDRTSSFADIAQKLHDVPGWDPTTGFDFFYKVLPSSLGAKSGKWDEVSIAIEEKCRQALQKTGNCWFISPKSAPLGILLLEKLIAEESVPHKSSAIREKAYGDIVASVQVLYKYYSTFLRLQILKEYMERPPDSIGRDHELVQRVVEKLYGDRLRYLIDERQLADKAYYNFSSLVETKINKKLPPPFKKEEIASWIEDYRKKFKLSKDFLKYVRFTALISLIFVY